MGDDVLAPFKAASAARARERNRVMEMIEYEINGTDDENVVAVLVRLAEGILS